MNLKETGFRKMNHLGPVKFFILMYVKVQSRVKSCRKSDIQDQVEGDSMRRGEISERDRMKKRRWDFVRCSHGEE